MRQTWHALVPSSLLHSLIAPSALMALAVFLCVSAADVNAQEDDPQSPPEVLILDGITVTARKVEEPIQQVPFGITVFGADNVERQRIVDVPTFARQTPGANIFDSGVRSAFSPSIRGNGSFAPLSSDDTSVPLFIDGVPVPLRASDREFFDIERIEVLRGPQSTTFGRNAQAGAISITTAQPTLEPFFQLGGEVGNLGFRRVTALASGPLTDSVAGRLAAQFDTRDGDIPDIVRDEDTRSEDLVTVSGKLVWTPAETSDVTLAVRYGYYDEEPTQGALRENTDFPQLALAPPSSLITELAGMGLTARHDFEAATLTSVTGVQYYSSDLKIDETDGLVFSALTGFPLEAFSDPNADFRDQSEDQIQVSQELRLDGELESGTRWLAGLSFYRADLDYTLDFTGPNLLDGNFVNDHTTTSYSVFGEVTVPLADNLRGIVGLRFTREHKDFQGRYTDTSGSGVVSSFIEDESVAFNLITGRAALSYDFTPNLTGFISVSRGAKAGGFQLVDPDVTRGIPTSDFNASYTWAYEAGVRGVLFDGLLDLSASAFFNDTKDEDVSVFQLLPIFQSVTENVDTQVYGLEVEAAVRPTDGLTLSGGLALLRTEITSSDVEDIVPGNETPFAPGVSFNLATEYEHPLTVFGFDGSAFGRIDYQYVGSRTVDPQNTFDLDPYDLVSLRVGWDSDRLSIYGFVDNLFDEVYEEATLVGGLTPEGDNVSFAIPGQPRRYGIGARVRF